MFVVGYLGDWRPATAVLFEQESLHGNIKKDKSAGKVYTNRVGKCLTARGAGGLNHDTETANFVINTAHTKSNGSGISAENTAYTLEASNSCNQAIAGTLTTSYGSRGVDSDQIANGNYSIDKLGPRRLTPIECERLQGFPDNYTNIPWRKKETSPDGPRYKTMGNSMAVPVMRWIGERIQMFEDLEKEQDDAK